MAESVINFSSYNSASEFMADQGVPLTYGSLSSALTDHPGWTVIEGGKVTVGATVGGAAGASKIVPISNYIKSAAELEGGVVGATEAVEVAETGVVAGEVTAGASGLFAGWTVGTAVAGVLAGAGIGIVGYELAPEFWTGVSNAIFPGEDINYEDIKNYSIIGLIKEEVLGQETQNTTYLSTQLAMTILGYAAALGIFNSSYYYTNAGDAPTELLAYPAYAGINIPIHVNSIRLDVYSYDDPQYVDRYYFDATDNDEDVYFLIWGNDAQSLGATHILAFSKAPFNYISTGTYGYLGTRDFVNRAGETIYCKGLDGAHTNSYYAPGTVFFNASGLDIGVDFWFNDMSIKLFQGLIDYHEAYKGTYELPDSPQIYDPTRPLPQQYPSWIGDREIETHGLEYPADDPALYPIPWIPVKMPEFDPQQNPEKYPMTAPGTQPVPGPGAEPAPSPYPQKAPQPDAQKGKLPDTIPVTYPDPTPFPRKDPIEDTDKPTDPTQPTNPTPTPPIVFPTIGGEANAIFTVYKPVISELNSLASVLWSSNFLENLIKIFTNNPMDAVISLHMLYATPHIGSRKNIKLGYLDTGIGSDVVDKQYLQIDCGTVRIPEYFGDARDYINSVVDVYLPFVGMRHLKTQDIVGSYVTIKAGVDVFTGTILYTINIRKTSGINQVMYAFEGNCAVALPLTGADKSRMFSVLGAAATGAAIGGVGGAAVGAFGSIMNGSQQADIQRSGNFGANSGAMGVKKPYIVVSRNVGYDANRYSYYHGYPANKTITLGACVGYTKVLDVRIEGISNATDYELAEIETLLKNGVIF